MRSALGQLVDACPGEGIASRRCTILEALAADEAQRTSAQTSG
jgi:hypothetical protein